ncbi:urease accessory protein UreD [Tabrizicola sp. BL-A-41-H6]|uniref:urease accessory protein UreD n=1 Tax=Tabrizicola sp. BL-A-41-H6 TaxID=3421107 RepID=UPI003D67C539
MTAISRFPVMQRAKGEAAVGLACSDGRVRLQDLRQTGSAKAILPQVGVVPEVVFLNTSGGLTSDDRLRYALMLEGGVAVATTQTAERAYRADGASAQMNVALTVGPGGWLDWLPQETILFDGARLDRRTRIDLGEGAGCLALEAVVLGRAAMGETVGRVAFRDRREIWRDGKPLSVEPLGLGDAALQAGGAGLGGARAFATIVMLGERLGDGLAGLRAVLDEPGVNAAASAFDGKLVVRMTAADGWPLRRQIVRALAVLRSGRPLPRVWQM